MLTRARISSDTHPEINRWCKPAAALFSGRRTFLVSLHSMCDGRCVILPQLNVSTTDEQEIVRLSIFSCERNIPRHTPFKFPVFRFRFEIILN